MPARRKDTYAFRQEPRAIRAKYRGQSLDDGQSNIMYDKRVVRGNTYAVRDIIRNEKEQTQTSLPFANTIRRKTKRKIEPPPIMEEKIPSHELLEELPAPAISLASMQLDFDTQAVDELHPTAYMPKPSGTDQGTSIEETDLFDFDVSVIPILEVIVGKSLEQGKLEVLQEEQVKIIKHNKSLWEMERNATHIEAQRLQAELQRHQEERERRLAQGLMNVEKQAKSQKINDARTMAKNSLTDMQETVVKRLANAGHFYDPTVNQIEGAFVPWLVEKLARELTKEEAARKTVDTLITKACAGIVEEMNAKLRAEQEAKEAAERAIREAEEERLRRIEEEAQRVRDEEEAQIKAAEEAEKAAELAAERARQLVEGAEQ